MEHKTHIVFLHGFLQDGRIFSSMSESLLNEGFSVSTPDLPGFGTNNTKDLSTKSQINWLIDFITRLNQPKIVLVAYSMGARLALQAMGKLQDLVSHFILESGTNGFLNTTERDLRKKSDYDLAKLARKDFTEFRKNWMNHPTLKPFQAIDSIKLNKLTEIQKEQDPEKVAQSLEQFGTGVMPYLSASYFADFKKPVLFLAGEMDTKFASKAIELTLFNSHFRAEIIPFCSHRIHLEQTELYLSRITSFIKEN